MSRVFTAAMIEEYCPECARLEAFEQPPCVDGHGPDCPEWLCLNCGTALLIDVPAEPVGQAGLGRGSGRSLVMPIWR